MASSLLVMSFAAGLHELSHLDDAGSGGCCAHSETSGGDAGSDHSVVREGVRQGCPAELQGTESGFCFFCTTPATMTTVAIESPQAGLPPFRIAHRIDDTDPPLQRFFAPSSPRPPPFAG